MNSRESQHLARVRHLRESFAQANERLVARLRAAGDEASARRAPDGWSPAQIAWHVATVTNRFAGVISGEIPAAALPDDFTERPWDEVAAGIPPALKTSDALNPPPSVSPHEAISMLEASGMRMARAFDAITPERGSRMGITNPIVGTITLYQVGEWATAHVIRHNRQAKRALGQG